MENADLPAMPLPIAMNDQECLTVNDYEGNKESVGLTKREHFASICQPPIEVLITALKEGYPSGFTVEQYIECAVGYKVKEADALLKELEK
jgi:hypothetical protein